MIEKVIQCEEEAGGKNVLFRLPKHVMQIGGGGNNPEIYIEDYAHGYLNRLASNDCTALRVAILVGEFMKSEGKRYVFIRGAIEAEEAVCENQPKFSSEIWAEVYGKIKRFFPNYEAVGWFLGGPEYLTAQNDTILQTHLDWFGGRDRVLFRMDPVEKTSGFSLYEKGELVKWSGYCIYYEKNEEMQDFLVSGKPQSVDQGYTEPVLVRMSQRLGRKTEAPEENTTVQKTEEEVKKEEKQEFTEKPRKEKRKSSGNGFGTGMMAAAALLVLTATGIKYTQKKPVSLPVPTTGLTPTPNGGKYLEETSVRPTDGIVPGLTEGAGGRKEGDGSWSSELEERFQKMEERELPTRPAAPSQMPPTKAPVVTPTKAAAVTPTKAPETQATPVPTQRPEPTSTPMPEPTRVVDSGTLPGVFYVVKSGDTLASICKRFYGDVSRMEEIKEVNQIPDENRIYAGQELYLP